MPERLTQRQRDILDFISSSIDRRGYPPTLREIGEHFGIQSTNGVNDHLKALEKKGFLAREGLKSRAMRPMSAPASGTGSSRVVSPTVGLRLGEEMVEVPVVGRVAAGQPLLAVENVEDTVRVDRFFLGAAGAASGREIFALRVKGESMIEDGILDGDYVIAVQQVTASNGDVVVAGIPGGEATVKRYSARGGSITLTPANAAMEPMVFEDLADVAIYGRVVTVLRRL